MQGKTIVKITKTNKHWCKEQLRFNISGTQAGSNEFQLDLRSKGTPTRQRMKGNKIDKITKTNTNWCKKPLTFHISGSDKTRPVAMPMKWWFLFPLVTATSRPAISNNLHLDLQPRD